MNDTSNNWTNKDRTLALFSLRFRHDLNEDKSVKSHAQPYFNEWVERYNNGIDNVKSRADANTLRAVQTIEKAEEYLTFTEFMKGE